MGDTFISRKQVIEQLGVHYHTIRVMAKRGDTIFQNFFASIILKLKKK